VLQLFTMGEAGQCTRANRVITFRFSCWSFCSRGVIGFLSGFEDEGVIFEQRDGVSNQVIQSRIAQPQGRLRASWGLLLAQNVGDVIGAERSCGCRFFNGAGYRLGFFVRSDTLRSWQAHFSGSKLWRD
jgi:hypothetical protein